MKFLLLLTFFAFVLSVTGQSIQASGASNIWQRNDGALSAATVFRPPVHDTVHPPLYNNLTKTGCILFNPNNSTYYGNDGVRFVELLTGRKAATLYATSTSLSNYMLTSTAIAQFQPAGDYVTHAQAEFEFQPIGNYLSKAVADTIYQPKGLYLTAASLNPYLTSATAAVTYQLAGSYLTAESDPLWTASASFGITAGLIGQWNSAFGWGNHATAGYLTSSALTPYITSALASATYYPLPTGNGTQYLNGAGVPTTFPGIPAATSQLTNNSGFITSTALTGLITLSQARAGISLTTASGATSTYNSSTGGLNIPTVPAVRRQEPYSGTTNASGVYTVTFATPFTVAPNIQASISNQSSTNQFISVSSVTTTSCTVNVYQRNSVTILGLDVLLSATVNVSGATVDVIATDK